MKKTALTLTLIATLTLSGCQTSGNGDAGGGWLSSVGHILSDPLFQTGMQTALSQADISAGLREALTVGTNQVVNQLGQTGGFNNDPTIRIPLPRELQIVDETLNKFGLGVLTTDLKNRMNAAAEIATPKAKEYFMTAITSMTIDDAVGILNGPNDAATQYLRRTTGNDIAADIAPIIQNALNQAGAIQAFDSVMGQYSALPFVSAAKTDLNNYVLDRTLDGIFHYVAREESAIRTNPAKRTTELLQKVFGSTQ